VEVIALPSGERGFPPKVEVHLLDEERKKVGDDKGRFGEMNLLHELG
jgi:hypothetical protein